LPAADRGVEAEEQLAVAAPGGASSEGVAEEVIPGRSVPGLSPAVVRAVDDVGLGLVEFQAAVAQPAPDIGE